jgi:hypothetical protein
MEKILSKLSIPFFYILAIAVLSISSPTDPFPYSIYPSLIILGYSILMEFIIYTLPYQRTIRLVVIWFFAIIVPPVWNGIGIGWLYGEKPPIASYDVALPVIWIFITIILYVYSIPVSLIETFRRKN